MSLGSTGSVHFVFHLCSAIRFVRHLCSNIAYCVLPCDWLYIADMYFLSDVSNNNNNNNNQYFSFDNDIYFAETFKDW